MLWWLILLMGSAMWRLQASAAMHRAGIRLQSLLRGSCGETQGPSLETIARLTQDRHLNSRRSFCGVQITTRTRSQILRGGLYGTSEMVSDPTTIQTASWRGARVAVPLAYFGSYGAACFRLERRASG